MAAVSSWLTAGCLSIMPAIAPKAKHVEPDISAEFPFEYRSVDVLDSQMSYVEAGTPDGPPVVLVHGNPTSAYLWRNVIPHLERTGRVIAVDLIGMGQSGKPNLDYRFEDHVAYFDAFMEALELRDVVLVAHDWGGGVAIDYAARHPENVRGIAHFEAVVKPMSFAQADAPTRFLFKKLRDPDEGHALIAEDNYFVERLLPMMAGRRLSEDEMAAYRAPFPTVESRRPVARWPREIPLDDEPADNSARIAANYAWLRSSSTPLLMLYANPGMIWTKKTRPELERELPRMTTIDVGSGLHYLQEVQPTAIGTQVAAWIDDLPVAKAPVSGSM